MSKLDQHRSVGFGRLSVFTCCRATAMRLSDLAEEDREAEVAVVAAAVEDAAGRAAATS